MCDSQLEHCISGAPHVTQAPEMNPALAGSKLTFDLIVVASQHVGMFKRSILYDVIY